MSDYEFTNDWFGETPEVWKHFIPMLPARKRFIEIGSYEGRSTVWIVENMLDDGGSLLCIDTWKGGEEHQKAKDDMQAVEERFHHNIGTLKMRYPDREVLVSKESSYYALAHTARWLPSHEMHYDFIYIDGSHIAKDVLTDACLAWPLLKVGGIMVFDDYMWGNPRDVLHRPKMAIDTFLTLFGENLQPLHVGYQVVLKKI